jgi:hypothetical protein
MKDTPKTRSCDHDGNGQQYLLTEPWTAWVDVAAAGGWMMGRVIVGLEEVMVVERSEE